MYNPSNLDLPDYEDQSLTEYIWEYSVGSWTHVVAVDSSMWDESFAPSTDVDFFTPFHYTADFHLLMWPEVSRELTPDVSFDFEQLEPGYSDFSSVRAEIGILLGLDDPDEYLDEWLTNGVSEGCDKLFIRTARDVRFEWEIRGWEGLTLEHLKANLRDLEFSKSFYVDEGLLLETFERDETNYALESLTYRDPELGAKLSLAKYHDSRSEAAAFDAALYLHRFGGHQLAKFHFPTLDLCEFCGHPQHLSDAGSCMLRLSTLRF